LSDRDHKRPPGEQRRLQVVLPEHELTGHAPLVYERLTKVGRPGSPEHRGLLAIARTLGGQAAARCLPPSARASLAPAFVALEEFVRGGHPRSQSVRDVRANTFALLPSLEAQTQNAVARAAQVAPSGPTTALHEHAQHTLGRFLGLSVHHTVAALCHALDALENPEAALPVPSDTCGALAYSRTALGSARNPEFQAAALEQARFERERSSSQQAPPESALQVQIFHEYLGARWRAHADQERRLSDEFIAWALGSAG